MIDFTRIEVIFFEVPPQLAPDFEMSLLASARQAAHWADSTSACTNTVRVPFSYRSGG